MISSYRKIIIILSFFGALINLLSCSTETENTFSEYQSTPVIASSGNEFSEIKDERIIVQVSESFARMLEKGETASLDGYTFERVIPEDDVFEARHRAAGLHKWYFAKPDGSAPLTKAPVELKSSPDIEVLEIIPPAQVSATIPFNDPGAYMQWHLNNNGSLLSGAVSGADINVVPVWNEFTAGSNEVIVGVIDTGVQADHPDLNGVVIPAGADGSRSFLNSTASHPYSYTPQRHGTHVAGIIAAINNNGTGGCGIAGGNDGTGGVKILDMQAIASEDGDSGDVFSAAIWAADHGAIIVNNSWNNKYDSESQVPETTDFFTRTAIDYFINKAGTDSQGKQKGPMKGGVVFFSAGNDSRTKAQPAMYEKVYAVGATGPAGEASAYTNYGSWVDICAPGGNYSAYGNTNAQIYSTVSGSTYAWMQGTSMSCPVVTGVAALLVSQYGGPGFTNKDLIEMLLGGADVERTKSHTRAIGPMVDAYESMVCMNKDLTPSDDVMATISGTTATIEWTVKNYGSSPYYAYKAVIGEKESDVKDADPFNLNASVRNRTVNVNGRKAGTSLNTTFYQLERGKDYYATAIGYSRSHRYSTGNKIVKFRLNSSPSISRVGAEKFQLTHLQKDSGKVRYSDPEGDELSFVFDPGSSAGKWGEPSDGIIVFYIDGAAAPAGNYTAKATVTDGEFSANVEIPYTILPNEEPSVTKEFEDILSQTGSISLNLDEYFRDADGDILQYSISSSSNTLVPVLDDGKLILASETPDAATITVSATDGLSAPVVCSFRIRFYSDSAMDLYPTRVSSQIHLAVANKGQVSIKIYSSTGKIVHDESLSLTPFDIHDIDLSSCAPGVYTVKISGACKATYKIVKI